MSGITCKNIVKARLKLLNGADRQFILLQFDGYTPLTHSLFLACAQPMIGLAENTPPIWEIALLVIVPSTLIWWGMRRRVIQQDRE
jgi:hypothetical protein